MARILGINLKDDKRLDYSLTLLYGVGRSNVKQILASVNIKGEKKIKELSEDDLRKISSFIEKNVKVEGNLKEEIGGNIKRLREIGSFRGMRHSRGLPARGQRTKSNARTKRGKRKTVGALKKEDMAKIQQKTVPAK
ncbi:30S ribosomal protein S13 [Candidatus Roizmanbacteria bacterium RIFCSPHIGHO2_02_FULL_37_13b]|uniref:Small ribosomal subunit protein uS13 n=1 Tax=Candidatus Roizmanbacteria bacterium RIFCSPLOWO2_02_FULL_36_11 TaxID=1802071 RepID=A0A1F7JCH5_9BACT|nr:MAG: 30S ribosomal protein S13 [Candidatus Roizmanbacteria bacterium RIFCSPHIGHO2_02_FULL_37_13b]OGK53311.1 MAG: 30S ribosomal protein S13 [Candidatus Roizmanbacteria bacterium RIFCSPLOWO2_02_FULL_36_11]